MQSAGGEAALRRPHRVTLYFFERCDKVLPAADFDAADVRPSRNTFDAADAAVREVDSFGLCACVNALAAAVFDALPVLEELNTFAAALAALGPVVLVAIYFTSYG